MFKKPLSDVKTSAPLRGSDRRKLRARVAQTFALDADAADLLVPDGLLALKYSAHAGEPGVLYLAPGGDPLWFTAGKGSDELIPTVYTLWKHPALLPSLSTPAAVIPVLIGGADLMLPGVVQRPTSLHADALVSVTQYIPGGRGPPLAVGRLAVDLRVEEDDGRKGKAVTVLHTWKDHLWGMGAKGEPPEALEQREEKSGEEGQEGVEGGGGGEEREVDATGGTLGEGASGDHETAEAQLSPEDVSAILRTALLQALATTLSALPPSAFPLPASTLYTAHLLPARPAPAPATPIDIKHSAFKSLTAFLRAAEKQGLLRLKDAARADVVVAAVQPMHADVRSHRVYRTVGDAEERRRREREREERREREEDERGRSVSVEELWKPHGAHSVAFFGAAQRDTSALYTLAEVKAVLDAYIATHALVHRAEPAYIQVGADALLREALYPPAKGAVDPPEFVKRGELPGALAAHMQAWHRLQVGAQAPVIRKGRLQPVAVAVKLRQGRKACTLVTGFEAFFVDADALAEGLRARCASATSVSPAPGKGTGTEVMVQGKQVAAVVGHLVGAGIPTRWIATADLTGKKK
ncbi:hypothetical protein FA95DRAFT_1601793 [Auriscalpium vulgare]|uniref:Uncharacterized protein n=1 Tax=Auriscalpium vulgare TaxID=40419 RepID=A0ACB8S750_9AGAM|nr:hypothetical protein FA95DRAFT_1601793 [Auriscalpium vulgare]